MIFYIPKFADASQLAATVGLLDYKTSSLGEEILDFGYIPPGFEANLGEILGRKISAQAPAFRKPWPFIHYEDFTAATVFTCAYVLGASEFTMYRHQETGTESVLTVGDDVQAFVNANCYDRNKWEATNTLKLAPGDVLMFKPWLWHSIVGNIHICRIDQNDLQNQHE